MPISLGINLSLTGGRFSAPSGGGGPVQIAHNSTSLHPDAWVSDNFDYGDTAAWLTAARNKTGYLFDFNTTSCSISNDITFGGHNVLKQTNPAGSAAGAFYFQKPDSSGTFWVRYGQHVPAVGYSTGNTDGAQLGDDENFNIVPGLHWQGSTGDWIDDNNGETVFPLDTTFPGNNRFIVYRAERIDGTLIRCRFWKDGVEAGAVVDITNPTNSLNAFAYPGVVVGAGKVGYMLFAECIDAADNPDPYGLL